MKNSKLNTKINATLFGLLLLILSTACTPTVPTVEPGAQPESENNSEENTLIDTDWDLLSIDGLSYENSGISLTFNSVNLSGSDGCNHFGGLYHIKDGSLVLDGPLAMTEMACPEMEQGAVFIKAFMTSGLFVHNGNQLTIQSDHGELVFMTPASAVLENTHWQLTSISQQDGIVSMAIDENIYFQIDENRVDGNGGCNAFGGDAQIDANNISFNNLFSTLMACLDDEVNQREREFLDALEKTVSYTINRQSLTLLDDKGNLVATFTAKDAEAEVGFDEENTGLKTMYVGTEQVDCVGVAPQKCLLVKENIEDDYTYFYDQISGFDWEAGFEYELLVSVTEIENPPADASSLSYELVEIVSVTPVTTSVTITGTKWSLVNLIVGGDAVVPIPAGAEVFFTISEESVTGGSGCNSFRGSATLSDDDGLSFGPLITTRMACSEDKMNLENGVLESLSSVSNYTLNGGLLELKNGNGLILATFKAAAG
jgi:heat shock protein HslJ